MKFLKAFLVLSFLAFFLGSCIIYRTRSVPANAATFNEFKDKRRFTMQMGGDSARYIRIDEVRNDGITVIVGDVKRRPDHAGGDKAYWRSLGKYSMGVSHLTVSEGVPTDLPVQLSYKDMTTVSVHSISGLTILSGLAALVGWLIFVSAIGL